MTATLHQGEPRACDVSRRPLARAAPPAGLSLTQRTGREFRYFCGSEKNLAEPTLWMSAAFLTGTDQNAGGQNKGTSQDDLKGRAKEGCFHIAVLEPGDGP